MIGEDDHGPRFFSPARIQAARDCQESRETEEALRQQEITDKKVAAAAKKLQKEKNKEEKAEVAAIRRQLQAEAQAQEAAEKLALQEAKKAAAERKKERLATEKALKTSKKAGKQRKTQGDFVSGEAVAQVEPVISGTSRTRTIYCPKKYDD